MDSDQRRRWRAGRVGAIVKCGNAGAGIVIADGVKELNLWAQHPDKLG